MASDATGLRDYKGAAVSATLSAGISNATTTFSISPVTNWPTGSSGSFTIVIDQGTSSEEAMLCSAQSAGVLTVTTRGYDGTTATTHNLGAPVLHVPVALDFAEANQIANTHAQTSKTTPVAADEMPLFDSAASFGLKKLTLTNLAAFLASLTQVFTNKDLTSGTNTFPTTLVTTTGSQNQTDPKINQAINAQTGTTYTPVLADNNKVVTLNNASAIAVTIPTNATVAFPVGARIDFIWTTGAGQPTISAVTPGTTTITSAGATSASPKIATKETGCTAIKLAADVWQVIGSLA